MEADPDDLAAGARHLHGRAARDAGAHGIHDDVGHPAPRAVPHLGDDVLARRVEDRLGTHGVRHLQARLVRVHGDQREGAARARDLKRHESDGAAADHDDDLGKPNDHE